jgi:hypothetical protein
LQEACCEGPSQALFLLEKFESVIIDLCDFCLQDKSPKAKDEKEKRVAMGGDSNKVKFEPLISLASHMVRCKYTPQMLEYLSNEEA